MTLVHVRWNMLTYQTKVSAQRISYQMSRKSLITKGVILWKKHMMTTNNSLSYKGGRILSEESLQNIRLENRSLCNHQKFLVYKCDSSRLCGGWADRQKGIVSTFLMSLLTNRMFLIDMGTPCELENILLPSIYNWSLCYDFVARISAKDTLQVNYIESGAKIRKIQSFNFDQKWLAQVVVSKINGYAINEIRQHKLAKSRLKWLLNISNEEVIHLVLHTLFKPTVRILKDISTFYNYQVKSKPLVCGHIRVGKNPSVPLDTKLRFGEPNTTAILHFLNSFEDVTNVIYIASDSENVKVLARKSIKSYININRTIVHVDRLGQFKDLKADACEGLKTVVIEQLILSLCDKLVLIRSGLSTMAAYMRGMDDNLFIFHPRTRQIIKANLTDLQRHFLFL